MIKLKYSILLLILSAVGSASAQSAWDLNKCIEYAKSKNLTIQRRQLDRQSAEINVNTAQMSRLPNLNASISQNFNFGLAPTANNTYASNNNSQTSFGVESQTNLFNGFYTSYNINYTNWNLKASLEDINQAVNDISVNIAVAYLQILYNKELVRVSEEQVQQSQSQLEKTSKLVEAGRMPTSELYESKAQLAKDELTLTQNKNALQLSLVDLAQLMELEDVKGFDITVPDLQQVVINSETTVSQNDSVYQNALNFRPGVKAAEYRLNAGQEYIKMMKASFYPSLVFTAQYGNGYYYAFSQGSSNPAFSSQLKNNYQALLGATLSIPIFNRYTVRNNVKLASIDLQRYQISLTEAKKSLYKEIQQAYYNALAAKEKYISAEKSVSASEEAFRYAQERFDAGRSTTFEFNETKLRLVGAQSDLAKAKYEFIFRTKLLDFYNGILISL
jgi:outer membrane protein